MVLGCGCLVGVLVGEDSRCGGAHPGHAVGAVVGVGGAFGAQGVGDQVAVGVVGEPAAARGELAVGGVVGAGEGVSPGGGDAGAVALGIVGVGFTPLVLIHAQGDCGAEGLVGVAEVQAGRRGNLESRVEAGGVVFEVFEEVFGFPAGDRGGEPGAADGLEVYVFFTDSLGVGGFDEPGGLIVAVGADSALVVHVVDALSGAVVEVGFGLDEFGESRAALSGDLVAGEAAGGVVGVGLGIAQAR